MIDGVVQMLMGGLAQAGPQAVDVVEPEELAGAASGSGGGSFADGLVLTIVGMGVVVVALMILMFALGWLGKALRDRATEPLAPERAPVTSSSNSYGEASAAGEAPTAAAGGVKVTTEEEVSPEVLAVLTAAATAAVRSQVTPELVAVLSASAAAALGVRVRVRRVIALDEDVRSWIAGGRAEVMHSHRLGGVGQFRQ